MNTRKRSKCVVLVEALAQEIAAGILPPGSDFYTMEGLMRKYKISIVTANKVLRELKELGLLEVQKGRRSRVPAAGKPRPVKLSKPIGIINPGGEFFRQCRWRNALLQDIQQRIIAHGNQALWLPEDFDAAAIKERCAGLIYSNEQISEAAWRMALASGIPCVRLSFEMAGVNSVFIDYRPALDQISLHIAGANCRRVAFLAHDRESVLQATAWIQRRTQLLDTLREYGIGASECHYLTAMPCRGIKPEEWQPEPGRGDDKIAFIGFCGGSSGHIVQCMSRSGRQLHCDYEIYSLAFVDKEILIGFNTDMKYLLAAERMVDMLYRQCTTGRPQVGEAILAEFVTGN